MIYNRFNREISCHCVTVSPNQSVICLAPCHQTSQSFALPPATKPVSHLTCPLPPCHRVSQSFALPPATKPVSHLPFPLPPNQSVIWLALYHRITVSPHHYVTTSLHHCITASPHHRVSQSFVLPPATKPVSHLPCPLPPNQSVIWLALYHHVTASPCHCATASPCHCTTASPCHRITVLVSHLSCPLPPNQSVLCLAPWHQTSQSFDLPSTTASPRHHATTPPCHCITMSLCHCLRFSPPHGYESDWLMLTSTVLIG